MVTINYAYTEKINPAGATPVLTRDQVWTGLQIKQKHPEAFVPVIERTEVISESENELIRMVYFKGKDGQPGEQVKEVCNSYYPTRVDFHQPNGTRIMNTVSDGEGMTEHDYNLTYTFEWKHADVVEGSEEHQKLATSGLAMAKTAVHGSIVAIREMVTRGEIK